MTHSTPKTNGIYIYQLTDTDYDKSGFLNLNKTPILSGYAFRMSDVYLSSKGIYFIKFGYHTNEKEVTKLYAYFGFTWIDPFSLADSYMSQSQFGYLGNYTKEVMVNTKNEFHFFIGGQEDIEICCEFNYNSFTENGSDPHYLIANIQNRTKGVKVRDMPFRFLRGVSKSELRHMKFDSL